MKLLCTDTSPLADPGLWDRALACSLPARRDYALAYRFPKDQRLSLAAGLLLSRLLRSEGLAPETAGLAFSHSVKPELPGHPGWHFSLAHSGSMAVCMLGRAPCGVDVETVGSFGRCEPEHILAPGELALLACTAEEARPALLARLWTRKEAFLKCLGIGLAVEPKELSVHPAQKPLLREGRRYVLKDYPLAGYGLAACLPEGVPFPGAAALGMAELVASLEQDRAKQEQAGKA
ncbi:MAG: 4'-phosphopantetheinyl transferase superfamily protein [Desulfovibrio sp.]|nr:4'-phosphopantetheinyl transferase superfamily protein [Desulfovibrio sp.]